MIREMVKHLIIALFLMSVGCAENAESISSTKSPRIRKSSQLVSPSTNQTYKLGDELLFEVATSDDAIIDSIKLEGLGEVLSFDSKAFTWIPQAARTGTPKITLSVFLEGKKETLYPRIKYLAKEAPKKYTYRVINTYPHDDDAYTQGLFFKEDTLFESTGQNGRSTMRKVEVSSGRVISKIDLSNAYFGEGCVLWGSRIIQLTWTSGKAFVYDLNFNLLQTFQYPTEGWGITNLAEHLIMSDGTEKLYVMDPENFSQLDVLEVHNNESKVDKLNELEYINGKIFANVYGTENVVIIDPSTGTVEGSIDFSGIIERTPSNSGIDYVLNGIAYDEKNDRMFVTGKLWAKLFEVELIEKSTI